jgi:hypothetical protein
MPSKRARVQEVLDHVAESLEGIEKPVLRLVLPVLNRAHSEVEGDLRRWLAQQHGTDTFTAQRYRNVLMHLEHSIAQIEATGVLLESGLKRSMASIGPLSLQNLESEWRQFSTLFEGSAQPLAFDEAIILARGKKLLWPRFESSAKKYAGEAGEGLKFELAVSRARSETIDELTNRLEARLPAVFKSGRWDVERLARTETMNGYNLFHEEAIAKAAEEDGELRRRWDATVDFRRCRMCASLDGQVVKVGEKFHAEWKTMTKKGLRLHVRDVDEAPAHPCCRCVVCAWRESWASYARHGLQVHPAREYREAA